MNNDFFQNLNEDYKITKDLSENFFKTINRSDIGFFHLSESQKLIDQTQKCFKKFEGKKFFIHVGIGGSGLGPIMLIDSLKNPENETQFFFLDNIDPDYISNQLNSLKNYSDFSLEKCLFYIVSKSGTTAETISVFSILNNWISNIDKSYKIENMNNYFVFCTDPQKGDLREISKKHDVFALDVPENIGGRFSVLTPVGLLPAIFAGINIEKLINGAKNFNNAIKENNLFKSLFFQSADLIYKNLEEKNLHQTVLMPYSSKLKSFSYWFVQLWSESLGKYSKTTSKSVGLTPIASYGATDQHSQMQLFMEGPLDKYIIFIEVDQFDTDFDLTSNLNYDSLNNFTDIKLSELMRAEFEGTLKALKQSNRPFMHLRIPKIEEESMGYMIQYFASLTVLMAEYLSINAFNQPGVEAAKVNAKNWLKDLSQRKEKIS